jgi:GH18 family chitinase
VLRPCRSLNKIVVGLALYGKTFVLFDTQHTLPGRATFKDGGDPTSCIETRGDMAYNDLASLIHPPNEQQQPKVMPLLDNDGKAFYFVYGNRQSNWVGYDDRPSLNLKLQMVTELDLADVM